MKTSAKPWIIGNWKMNLSPSEARALLFELERWQNQNSTVRLSVAVPSLYASQLSPHATSVGLLVQNCHWAPKGAFTGEVSPPMLTQLGIKGSLIGHSERREFFGESSSSTGKKIAALRNQGLNAILCVGESLLERQNNTWKNKLEKQILEAFSEVPSCHGHDVLGPSPSEPQFAIAYEPVWAIGTGLSATPEQANDTHSHIYSVLESLFPNFSQRIPVIYGGSVTPENAKSLLAQPHIHGALVGGASLTSQSFLKIAESCVGL